MKRIKKISLVLFVVLGVIAIGIFIFIQTLKPKYDGELQLPELESEVEIYFDTYGIPHIYGQSEEDAYRALGYVHAQDRLWQMELLRRIGRGGLSEVFGKDLVSTDKFLLSLGIDEASEETVKNLDINSETVKFTQAYLDGINAFIEEGPTPVEFYLTGVEKKPFILKDVYNTIGYMAFSFAMAHKTDPLMSNIKDKLGYEYLQDLEIDIDFNLESIKNFDTQNSTDIKNTVSEVAFSTLKKLPVPMFEGSNSWVISPSKTKNGKVIFANDPHIGFSQPSIWYEAHVVTPTYEKYGYYLAGVPFPLLGHDKNIAYGLTMFENDDIDFYYEELHSSDTTKYKYKGEWKDIEIVQKTIKVKDSQDVNFSYKKTIHGPVMNGIAEQITGNRPIAMSWIYTKLENNTLNAFNGVIHAKNTDDFKKSLAGIHAPGLNIMYGDAKGNVAWFATAQLYQMPDSINTKFVLNGSSGNEEPLKYLNFSENPHAINPDWNYVYSANNQSDSINGKIYPGYYLPENRAKRIVTLLDAKNDWDKEAVGEMINDVTSETNPLIVENLTNLISKDGLTKNQKKLISKLKKWNGEATINSVESTFFHRWVYFFLKETFNDELGDDYFDQLMKTSVLKRTIAPMASKTSSIWWDNSTTESVETKSDIINSSFKKAFETLEASLGTDYKQWTWGKVHTLEHEHPIGKVDALRSFFNVGPFPVNGTREVINNMLFDYTEDGIYTVKTGPSTRRVIDFSDIENSISILPTGQSGNPFSPHYKDQAQMYINGEFRKMMMNEEEIKNTASSVLRIRKK
ncbi:penicillin acylase family protein [Cellulophaga sp. HaHaR_3_176]|uniref:penicillin acylase family protein n=1 Tax=Cellulophaga sp. HaHaR_3_176 TaxID=1942464 RepID=UPI001C1F8384|nr:penicillin acylase family protein [Cellulophaga sp. HaHaR_3_176]QWX85063.1 penicillin acylase family protein [Cellulophaga sp. HaHaR_3_176]